MIPARPRVSVLTANYNGARHLRAAIASIQAQTLTDLELIVVDDASTDDSVAILRAEAERDPRIRLVLQGHNGGPAAARNAGLRVARGRWIAVFDADDLMAPDRLERLVELAEQDGADIVADNLAVFEDGAPEATTPLMAAHEWRAPRWIDLAGYIGASRMYAPHPGPGYLKPLISTEFLALTAGGYRTDLPIGEDYDLVLRLLASGARMRFEPDALYRYRRHGGSVSRRLMPAHLRAMLAADAVFERIFPELPSDVRRAQAARRRSLMAALGYDTVIARLKAGDVIGGLWAGLIRPSVWPLLLMPLKARLRRALSRLPGRATPLHVQPV